MNPDRSVNSQTDTQLMLSVRDGAVGNLAPLFERHHVKLYNYYVRLTGDRDLSEDMVQDVFLRILKYRHTFRGEGLFTTWMFSIARNVQTDYARRWRREQPLNDGEESDGDGSYPLAAVSVADSTDAGYDTALLQDALLRLSADKREALILSRYQGFKYSEIAEISGCSVEAIKVRVHRAMKDLRKIFFQLSGERRR